MGGDNDGRGPCLAAAAEQTRPTDIQLALIGYQDIIDDCSADSPNYYPGHSSATPLHSGLLVLLLCYRNKFVSSRVAFRVLFPTFILM